MSAGAHDFEALLREALSPVDPPADLAQRLESTLVNLTELAQEELDTWELSAMRDPRNWVRPAAAAVIGVTARTALVTIRVRRRHRTRKQQSANLIELAQRTMQDIEKTQVFGSSPFGHACITRVASVENTRTMFGKTFQSAPSSAACSRVTFGHPAPSASAASRHSWSAFAITSR